MQLLKGIDRVRRPLAQDFEIRNLEPPLVAADRQATHLESVIGPGLVVEGLVRWYPYGDEHHSREAELNVRLLGAHQVTKMWRIESSAENPDAHSVSRGAGSLPDVAGALDQVLERA